MLSDLLSAVLEAKKAGPIHIWARTAEGKGSKRREKLKLLLKRQTEVLNQSKMAMEATQDKSLTHGVDGIGLQSQS